MYDMCMCPSHPSLPPSLPPSFLPSETNYLYTYWNSGRDVYLSDIIIIYYYMYCLY